MELALDLPWTLVSELIARELGLQFPPERRAELQRGIAAAAAEWGFASSEQCIDWMLSPNFTKANAGELARHLTIGETYFFRDAKTFDVLSQKILPSLFEKRRGSKTLHFWSAACCTGQEAYSIAILLQQLMPDLEDWNITIFGTDINSTFLEKAVAGVYGDWSFRETPDWFRIRYFQQVGEREWALLPRIKKMVTFLPLNLADAQFPFPFENGATMDMILCRNVLMYFTLPQARKVVSHLRKIIRQDGWLVAGPSEGTQVMAGHFVPVNFPGVILYKPAIPGLEQPRTPVYSPAVAEPIIPPRRRTKIVQSSQPVAVSFAEEAAAAADSGDVAAALACCDRWIQAEKLNPAAHYLRGVVLQESGDPYGARQSLQRALYLEPSHILAHFTLANLARASGAALEASRHFDNTLKLLETCPPDQPLPESGGITAARLKEIILSTR